MDALGLIDLLDGAPIEQAGVLRFGREGSMASRTEPLEIIAWGASDAARFQLMRHANAGPPPSRSNA
jgi:hypothetical protein